MPSPKAPELSKEQKELQDRIGLFDKELTALQQKYQLRIVANVVFPGGAVLNVPIQAFPIGPMPEEAKADTATAPE